MQAVAATNGRAQDPDVAVGRRTMQLSELVEGYQRLRKDERSAVRKRREEASLKPLQVELWPVERAAKKSR